MSEPLHVHFEDLAVGEVIPLGACMVDEAAMAMFVERFAPGWDVSYGAPDAMVYALWKGTGFAPNRVVGMAGVPVRGSSCGRSEARK